MVLNPKYNKEKWKFIAKEHGREWLVGLKFQRV